MPTERPTHDPLAHALRQRYHDVFGGVAVPVPVESIAEDLLGLQIEERWDLGDCSGMLLPARRQILLNAVEGQRNDPPLRRFRFTIAHEIGHWVCHCLEGRRADPPTAMCRAHDLRHDADRTLEREANVFAAELLMPEPAVRDSWGQSDDLESLAGTFDVSPMAMAWRLYAFGLGPRPDNATSEATP